MGTLLKNDTLSDVAQDMNRGIMASVVWIDIPMWLDQGLRVRWEDLVLMFLVTIDYFLFFFIRSMIIIVVMNY